MESFSYSVWHNVGFLAISNYKQRSGDLRGKRGDKTAAVGFFFLATLAAFGSSRARDWTCATCSDLSHCSDNAGSLTAVGFYSTASEEQMESETSELGVEGAGEPAGESLNSLSPHRFMQDPTMDLDDESTLISSAASSSELTACFHLNVSLRHHFRALRSPGEALFSQSPPWPS